MFIDNRRDELSCGRSRGRSSEAVSISQHTREQLKVEEWMEGLPCQDLKEGFRIAL